MACEKHNWWFDSACPGCAADAAPITAPVTKPPEPPPLEPEPEIPTQNFPDTQSVPAGDASGEPDPENIGSNENLARETSVLLVDEMPPIPNFLIRNPDNTLKFPAPWGPLTPLIAKSAPEAEDPKTLSDSVLYERLYDPALSVAGRQKYLLEATARENKKKAYERIDKLKAAKQNKDTTDPTE